MSKLDEIVTVNIDIAAPAVDEANFDNLLIVGPPPAVMPSEPPPLIGAYADLAEVNAAGYVSSGGKADPIGVAARIAFSQNPKPARIFIAAQQRYAGYVQPIRNAELKIITASNAAAEGLPVGTINPSFDDLPWLQLSYERDAVTSLGIEIEKDGVVVWGKMLPNTANPNALVQVVIGTPPTNTEADQMNIPSGYEAGTYTITLTAVQNGLTTVLKRSVEFDGADIYTQAYSKDIIPLQTPVETLTAIAGSTGWYVICAVGIPESGYEEIAEWTESQTKQFAYTFLSDTNPVGAIYYRSQGWCGLVKDHDLPDDVPSANAYLHVAAVAKCLPYTAGSETWAFKRLAAVYPSEISTTLRKALTEGHSNFFSQYAGRNITMNGQVRGGEWIDVIRGRDWLQNDMQLRIASLMFMRSKVPYTNAGIALVENQMIASLKAAVQRGIVAPDEYDEDGSLIPGFVVKVPNAQNLTATQRASRILSDCKFTARIAGAIHVVRVDGVLTYEGGADFGTDV
jgi:hypothetical protein